MQSYLYIQSILLNPQKPPTQFKFQLQQSQITQFTYICLLLNTAVSIKRQNYPFQQYLHILITHSRKQGHTANIVNYTGYKDKIAILMNACEKAKYQIVRILCKEKEIKVNVVDPNGWNIVYYVIRNNDESQGVKMLELFKSMYPSLLTSLLPSGYSPLFYSVQKCRLRLTQFLLSLPQCNPNQQLHQSGNSVLHQLIKSSLKYSFEDIRKIIEMFIKYGYNIKIRNNMDKMIEEYAYEIREVLGQAVREVIRDNVNNNVNTNDKQKQPDEQQHQHYFYYDNCEKSQISSKYSTTILTKQQQNNTFEFYKSQEQKQLYYQSQYQPSQHLIQSRSNKSLLTDFNYHNTKIVYNDFNEQNLCGNNLDQSQQYYEKKEENDHEHYKEEIGNDIKDINIRKISWRSERSKNKDDEDDKEYMEGNIQKVIKRQWQGQQQQCQQQSSSQQQSFSSSQSSQQSYNDYLSTSQINHQKIHSQLSQLNAQTETIYLSSWSQLQPFFHKLSSLIQSFGLYLSIIGSFATGLWTTQSDIDLALITISDNYVDFQKQYKKFT